MSGSDIFLTKFKVDTTDLKKVHDQAKRIGDAFTQSATAIQRMNYKIRLGFDVMSQSAVKASRSMSGAYDALLKKSSHIQTMYEREATQLARVKTNINSISMAAAKAIEQRERLVSVASKQSDSISIIKRDIALYQKAVDATQEELAAQKAKTAELKKQEAILEKMVGSREKKTDLAKKYYEDFKSATGQKTKEKILAKYNQTIYGVKEIKEKHEPELEKVRKQIKSSTKKENTLLQNVKKEESRVDDGMLFLNSESAKLAKTQESIRKYDKEISKLKQQHAELAMEELQIATKLRGTRTAAIKLSKAEQQIVKEKVAEQRRENVDALNKINDINVKELKTTEDVAAAAKKLESIQKNVSAEVAKTHEKYSDIVSKLRSGQITESERKSLLLEEKVAYEKINGLLNQNKMLSQKTRDIQNQMANDAKEKVAAQKRENVNAFNKVSNIKSKDLKTADDVAATARKLERTQKNVSAEIDSISKKYSRIVSKLREGNISESERKDLLLEEKLIHEKINGLRSQDKVLSQKNREIQSQISKEAKGIVERQKRENVNALNKINDLKVKDLKTTAEIASATRKIENAQKKVAAEIDITSAKYSDIVSKLRRSNLSDSRRKELLLEEKLTYEKINGLLDQNRALSQKTRDIQRQITKDARERVEKQRILNTNAINKTNSINVKDLKTAEEIEAATKKIERAQKRISTELEKTYAKHSEIVDKLRKGNTSYARRKELLTEEKVTHEKINGLMSQKLILNQKNREIQRQITRDIKAAASANAEELKRLRAKTVADVATAELGAVVPENLTSREAYKLIKDVNAQRNRVLDSIKEKSIELYGVQANLSKNISMSEKERYKALHKSKMLQEELVRLKKIEAVHSRHITDLTTKAGEAASRAQEHFTKFRQVFFTGLILFGTASQALRKIIHDAGEAEKAMKALDRQARLSGIFGDKARNTIRNLEFVQNGLVSIAEASKAVRNLMRLGFGFDMAIDAVRKITEIAIENKQSALTLGQAVVSTTEGFRQELSVLADAGGITKNLSVIYGEFAATLGKTEKSLTRQEKNMALMAEINREAAISAGALDSVMNTLSGSTDAVGGAITILSQNLGMQLKPQIAAVSKVLVGLIRWMSEIVAEHGRVITAVFGMVAALTSLAAVGALLYGSWQALQGLWTGLVAVIGWLLGSAVSPLNVAFGAAVIAIGGAMAALYLYDDSLKSTGISTLELTNAAKDLQTQMDNTYYAFNDIEKKVKDLNTPLEALKKEFMSLEEVQQSAFMKTRVEAAKTKEELLDLYKTINEQRRESIRLQAQEQLGKVINERKALEDKLSDGVIISETRAPALAKIISLYLENKYKHKPVKNEVGILAERLKGQPETRKTLEYALEGIEFEPEVKNKLYGTIKTWWGLGESSFLKLNDPILDRDFYAGKEDLIAKIIKLEDIEAELTKTMEGFFSNKPKDGPLEYAVGANSSIQQWESLKKNAADLGAVKESLLKTIDKNIFDIGAIMKRADMKDKQKDLEEYLSSFYGMRAYLKGEEKTLPNHVKGGIKKARSIFVDNGAQIAEEADKLLKAVLDVNNRMDKADKALQDNLRNRVNLEKTTQKASIDSLKTLEGIKEGLVLSYNAGRNKYEVKSAMEFLENMKSELELSEELTKLYSEKESAEGVDALIIEKRIKEIEAQNALLAKLKNLLSARMNLLTRVYHMSKEGAKQLPPEENEKAVKEAKKKLKEGLEDLEVFSNIKGLGDQFYFADSAATLAADKYVAPDKPKKIKKSAIAEIGKSGFGIEGKLREYRKFLKDRAKLEEEAARQEISVGELTAEINKRINEEKLRIAQDTANGIKQAFVDGYMGILDGTKKFSDVLYDVFKNMVERINRLVMERMIEESFIGAMFDSVANSITKDFSSKGSKSNKSSSKTEAGGSSPSKSVSKSGASPQININITAMDGESVMRTLERPDAQAVIQRTVHTAQTKNKILGGE